MKNLNELSMVKELPLIGPFLAFFHDHFNDRIH